MQDRSNLIVAAIVIFLGIVHFIMMPAVHKGAASKVVKNILDEWSQDSMLTAMNHWEDRDKYPNVVKVISYRIKSRRLLKNKDEMLVKINVDIKFVRNRYLPMNSQWEYVLIRSGMDWKVKSFEVSDMNPEDILAIQGGHGLDATLDSEDVADFEKIPAEKIQEKLTPKPAPTPDPFAPAPDSKPKVKVIPALLD